MIIYVSVFCVNGINVDLDHYSHSSLLHHLFLARSANLPTGLYILPSVMSYFYLFIYFTRSKAISVSTGPIFTIFSPNGRYLREFLPSDARLSAVYAVVVCVCVCVCVCVSVTLRYCIKTDKRRITQIMPHDSPRTLVF